MADALNESTAVLCERLESVHSAPTARPLLLDLAACWRAATAEMLDFLAFTIPATDAPRDLQDLEALYGGTVANAAAIASAAYRFTPAVSRSGETDLGWLVAAVKEGAPAFFWIAEPTPEAMAAFIDRARETVEGIVSAGQDGASDHHQKGSPSSPSAPPTTMAAEELRGASDALVACLRALAALVRGSYSHGLPWGTEKAAERNHQTIAAAGKQGNGTTTTTTSNTNSRDAAVKPTPPRAPNHNSNGRPRQQNHHQQQHQQRPPSPAVPMSEVLAAFTAMDAEACSARHPSVVGDGSGKVMEALRRHNAVLSHAEAHPKPADVEAFLAPTDAAIRDAALFLQRAQADRSSSGSVAVLQRLGDVVECIGWVTRCPARPRPYLSECGRVLAVGAAAMRGGDGPAASASVAGQWAGLVEEAGRLLVRYVCQRYPRGLRFVGGGRAMERRRQHMSPPDVTDATLALVVRAAERTGATDLVNITAALRSVAAEHGRLLVAIRGTPSRPDSADAYAALLMPLNESINSAKVLCRRVIDGNEALRREAHAVADSTELFTWVTADRPVTTVEEGFADVDFSLSKVTAKCVQAAASNAAYLRGNRSGGTGGGGGGPSSTHPDGPEEDEQVARRAEQAQAYVLHHWSRSMRDAMLKLVLFVSYRCPLGPPWGEAIMAPMDAVGPGVAGHTRSPLHRSLRGEDREAEGEGDWEAAPPQLKQQQRPDVLHVSTAAPPPPPPPPPPCAVNLAAAAAATGNTAQRVLDEINGHGLDITKTLRHVSAEEKAAYRAADAAVAQSSSSAPPPLTTTATTAANAVKVDAKYAPTGPPTCTLSGGSKWVIENQRFDLSLGDNANITGGGPEAVEQFTGSNTRFIELAAEALLKTHMVSISRCSHTYIRVPAKVNTVQVLHCSHVQLEVQDTIGPIEFTNCESVEVLIHGDCPTVVLDATDTAMVHLAGGTETQIVTAGTSHVNVTVPHVDEDGDTVALQLPLPQQFVTRVGAGDAITTKEVNHSGA